MQLHHWVNTLGQDLKSRYGETVRKLTIHGNFTCPNRDGTLGRGGCTFCNVASFADETIAVQSIAEQLAIKAEQLKAKSTKYLAYFQAYTSTYGEVLELDRLYREAMAYRNIVGLCVGTRPDCVSDAVLALLAGYRAQGFEIWLELGLQTSNDKTLKRINRGHGWAEYETVCLKARALGIKVCTHLIVGLPGESLLDYQQTIDRVVTLGVDGLKLHPLHIVTGSTMAKAYAAGKLAALTLEEYVAAAVMMIQRTPAHVVFHRVSATARKPTLIAPDWCEERWKGIIAVAQGLAESGPQGSQTNSGYLYPSNFR
ncbi:TIGR01212 family radical SAM protein [Motilimonas cestriensis]|uniref:TIGR01212 family radical SAM protein n=1 Tax=Motilimonas cestriensis TaxID=2742685 RepID=A0ABS8W5Y1_9GAMM|nr:TIGR01212 family radical SAM protein [Motilimonas cestriensis]MCE2594376.1 TIGR01212 family radical SAM protein [Motilimonas cestriensis]